MSVEKKGKGVKRHGLGGAVTAAGVADHLGVSRSTVSRAFTPSARIAPQTRAQILAAAEQLGYRPNAIAQALISRRSNIVSIILGDLVNPSNAQLLEELTATVRRLGLIPITLKLSPEEDISDLLPILSQYNVGSVIMTSMVVTRDLVDRCRDAGLNVALLNRVAVGADAVAVCADHEQGGALAASHVAALGRRRVAVVTGLAGTWTNSARLAGFRRGLEEAGLEPFRIVEGDYSYACGVAAAAELIAARPRPDAVLCANDLTALGVIDRVRDNAGIRIPDDLAVVGFDDIPMASWSAYDLTTIALPVARMVTAIGEAARRMTSGESVAAETTLLPSRLVVRGSTAAKARRPGRRPPASRSA